MTVAIDIYKVNDIGDFEEVAIDTSIKYVEIGDQAYKVKRKNNGVFIPGVNVKDVRDWIREIEEASMEGEAIYNCFKGQKGMYKDLCEDCKLPIIIQKEGKCANIILDY